MKKTLILTKKQAKHLLNNIPKGHVIKIMVKDANEILGTGKNLQSNL